MDCISCVNSFKNALDPTPLITGAKQLASKVASLSYQFFSFILPPLNKATESMEARDYLHLGLNGIINGVKLIRGSLPDPLRLFQPIVELADSIFSGFDLFFVGKYFFHKEVKGSSLPRIERAEDGTLRRKNKNYDSTKVAYHIKEGKFQKVVAKIGSLIKGIGGFVTLFNVFHVFDLAKWGEGLGKIPIFGKVLRQVISPYFFKSMIFVGGVIAYGALVVDSVLYIAKAIRNPKKELSKGLLELALRLNSLVIYTLLLVGVSTVAVIAPLCITCAVLGLASMFYSSAREQRKAAEEKICFQQMMRAGG